MLGNFIRKILPPVWFLIGTAVQILIYYLFPERIILSTKLIPIGFCLMFSGISLLSWAANQFRKVGTPVRPFEKSTDLVCVGPFRYTRNPMYLGILTMSCGCAFALRNSYTFTVPVFLYLIIKTGYIKAEEVFMENIFGQKYLDYKQKVRRWL